MILGVTLFNSHVFSRFSTVLYTRIAFFNNLVYERDLTEQLAMDRIPPEKRSWNMSRIRGKDTKPELCVRSELHSMGARFRLHRKDLPGKPDIVLPRYRITIFVHGCFWHRHEGCKLSTMPKTRVQFWSDKLESNVRRDKNNQDDLRALDWTPVIIWECEIKNKDLLRQHLRSLLKRVED